MARKLTEERQALALTALPDIQRRVKQGDANAMVDLADAYSSGEYGLPVDKQVARRLLARAERAGSLVPAYRRAQDNLVRRPPRGLAMFLALARRGHAGARIRAAQLILWGMGTRANPGRALKLLAPLGDSNDETALDVRRSARRRLAARGLDEAGRLRLVLREFRLLSYASRIRRSALPSLRLGASPRETMGTGAPRFGGDPDLPDGMSWPEHAGRPLSFLCQLRLSQLVRFDEKGLLPRKGLLWFFYDSKNQPWGSPEDRGSWRVLFEPSPARLLSRPRPEGAERFPPHAVKTFRELTLPFMRTNRARSLRLRDAQWTRYCAMYDAYGLDIQESEPRHRILGNEDAIQGDMTRRIAYQLAGADIDAPARPKLERAAGEWRLLLQLDSQPSLEWVWGDFGRIYFWIREQDLRAKRFENVWLQLQCS